MLSSIETPKELLVHLFKNIFDLSTKNIKAFKDKAGILNYTKPVVLSYKDITGLYKFDHITLAGCHYVNDWKNYSNEINPSVSTNMAISAASWEMVDVTILRINHELIQSAIVDVKPSVTPATVTKSKIESTDFQKNCNIPLTNKKQITNFYYNLVSQSFSYNIFIRLSMELISNDGVILDLLSY